MSGKLETDFLILLYDVARHMRTHADQSARKHGMTRAQWIILARLERQPGLSQNELAAIAEVAPITVARLVDRLEALGLVKRCVDPDDKRIIKRYRAKLRDVMAEGIDASVLNAMRIGLHKMKDNLNARRLTEAAA
jgi:MarR family transcriptional regulator for hemolysin